MEGEKRRLFDNMTQGVTLPPVILNSPMGKGRGWGFHRQTPQKLTCSSGDGNPGCYCWKGGSCSDRNTAGNSKCCSNCRPDTRGDGQNLHLSGCSYLPCCNWFSCLAPIPRRFHSCHAGQGFGVGALPVRLAGLGGSGLWKASLQNGRIPACFSGAWRWVFPGGAGAAPA